jgi:hypothetical protein
MPRACKGGLHAALRTPSTLTASLLLALLAVLSTPPAQADEPVKPRNRTEATAIIADARKILTPRGVERLEKVRIGGIDQWISVRGNDRRNPVLLYIHGGPGYVSIPMSWWFTRDLEEYFTVVQWDQRATGKTYLLADPAETTKPTALSRGSRPIIAMRKSPTSGMAINSRPLISFRGSSRLISATQKNSRFHSSSLKAVMTGT